MRSLKGLAILTAGFALGVLPAMGASHEVKDSGTTWTPAVTSVEVGDDVKWNWSGFHNVAFEDGVRSGNPQLGGTYQRTFTSSGTFNYVCEQHAGMEGTVTVTQAGTGTTGTETTDTGTTTTDTTTTPTTTTETDTTPPVITSLRRRASRRALTITFNSDEDGTVEATIRRRNPGTRVFRLVRNRVAAMDKGPNVVTLLRASRGMRRGAYRVTLVFFDSSERESRPRTLVFKIA